MLTDRRWRKIQSGTRDLFLSNAVRQQIVDILNRSREGSHEPNDVLFPAASRSVTDRLRILPRVRLLTHQQEQRDKHKHYRQANEEQRRALNVGELHGDAKADHR
ncbi:hypothetical protein R75465_03093 [Paraburkholderia aspalathi]|nr:hypothetical protein R75465_03093 [Paraburkholderia aspalathi]